MPISNYLETNFINASVRNTAYTPPATVYIALYSTAPTASTAGVELTGNGYSRQSVAFAAPTVDGSASNGIVTFGPATADWLNVVSTAVVDAATAGNILYFQSKGASIKSGDTIEIAAGDITLTIA